MTVKCVFCNDTKAEAGIPGPCVWCQTAAEALAAPVPPQAETATCAKSQVDAQPMAPPERMTYAEAEEISDHPTTYMNAYDAGLEAGLLYTHTDAGEVERLKHEVGELEADVRSFKYGLDAMRAMLAERDSILSELRDDPRIWIMTSSDLCSRINSSLSTASPATINQQGEGE